MQVGNYQILGEISRGSMGVIYKAHDLALDRTVAIKVMSTGGGEFAHEDQARFRREAKAMARIHHPNVVAIHGAGMVNGAPYIVMDFVEGETLNDRLRRGPLKPRHAAKLARDLARALEVAHGEGVLHRDLKPANVLLDRKGKVLLTDFGLAKDLYAGDALTLSQTVLGTPAYMSPEQASGALDRVGPQSDVYGLGAILYALLTGRPPIEGTVVTEVLERVIKEAPEPPTDVAAAVDPALEVLVLRCLEKEPLERFQGMRELREALEGYLRPPRPRGFGGATVAAATTIGALLGLSAGILVGRASAPAAPAPAVATRPPPPTPADPPAEPAPTTPAADVEEPVEPAESAESPPPEPERPRLRPPSPRPPSASPGRLPRILPPAHLPPGAPGPEPKPIGPRAQAILDLQTAIARLPVDLPSRTNAFGFQIVEPVAQSQLDGLTQALRGLQVDTAQRTVDDLVVGGSPFEVRLGLNGLVQLGQVFRCARVLGGLGDPARVLPGFQEFRATQTLLDDEPGRSVQGDFFTTSGGYWEGDGDGVRVSGRGQGPLGTSFLLRRDSQRPAGSYALTLTLSLEHVQVNDGGGVVFGARSGDSFLVCYVRRSASNEIELRVGAVEGGEPDLQTVARARFATEVTLQVTVAPRSLGLRMDAFRESYELREPIPQGFYGLFRSGTSVVRYGRLRYEPQ